MRKNEEKSVLVPIVEAIDNFFDKVFKNTILTGAVFFPLFLIVFLDSSLLGMILKLIGVALVIIAYVCGRKVILNREDNRIIKIAFYEECVKYRIKDLSRPYQKQKAELLAKRWGCKFTDIIEYYEEAKIMAVGNSLIVEEEDIDVLFKNCPDLIEDFPDETLVEARKHVQLTSGDLTSYSDYYGRDKRLAILNTLQQEYRSKAEDLEKSTKTVVRGSIQRERNPGVAGGIASGLFGGFAGVAAYLDVEKQNAQIRAQNDAMLDALGPAIFAVTNKAYSYEHAANALLELIDDAKVKVVADCSDEEVFSYLTISSQEVFISRTGSFTIKASVQVNVPQEKLMEGTKRSVIDGAIAADLYQQGKHVGRAIMVLPTFGIKQNAIIEGIDIAKAKQNVPYKVKFSPYRLWIMEE